MDRQKLYGKKRDKTLYVFDIDGTLTHETEGWNYLKRTPRFATIFKMKVLREKENCSIMLWTARHECDRSVTEEWLHKYEVPYDGLVMGKPYWDLYICDKAINIESWLQEKKP